MSAHSSDRFVRTHLKTRHMVLVVELRSGLTGRVSVGTVMTPSASLVPEAISLLKSRHKRLQVAITVDTSKVMLQRLRAGEIDVMVGRVLDTETADDVTFEPLTD